MRNKTKSGQHPKASQSYNSKMHENAPSLPKKSNNIILLSESYLSFLRNLPIQAALLFLILVSYKSYHANHSNLALIICVLLSCMLLAACFASLYVLYKTTCTLYKSQMCFVICFILVTYISLILIIFKSSPKVAVNSL